MKSVVGRKSESDQIRKGVRLGRNILIEGPVGVGKTFLVSEILESLKSPFHRVDGDTRYSEQKLTGWFDPPLVLKKGYVKAAFFEGPLTLAMRKGAVLFVNELNRMPEAVQNILLPAMDERKITIPKIGEIVAKDGFLVVATQNPREFTATHALSEALMDRFEMVRLGYQAREEELEILAREWPKTLPKAIPNRDEVPGQVIDQVLDLVRQTREHPSIKRGASIRAAIAVGQLMAGGIDIETALLMAIPGRIEMVTSDDDAGAVVLSLFKNLQQGSPEAFQKKKSRV